MHRVHRYITVPRFCSVPIGDIHVQTEIRRLFRSVQTENADSTPSKRQKTRRLSQTLFPGLPELMRQQ
jgi:hypothetical protein